MPKGKYLDWSQWDHLLGVTPDLTLSKSIGCSRHAVIGRRLRLGINAAVHPVWTKEDTVLLARQKHRCKDCGEIKQASEFVKYRRHGVLKIGRQCLVCNRSKQRQDRIKRKQKFIDDLGGSCQNCGFNKHISCLQFHHVSFKSFEPHKIIFGKLDLEKINKEIDKCCLLCSNCHDAYHGGELDIEFTKRSTIGWTVDSSGDALDSQTAQTEEMSFTNSSVKKE